VTAARCQHPELSSSAGVYLMRDQRLEVLTFGVTLNTGCSGADCAF
jgi:hypothetical protein